jgi:uncharacterized protein HemY
MSALKESLAHARAHLAARDPEAALEALATAEITHGDHPTVLLMAGAALQQLARFDEARARLQRAAGLLREQASVFAYLDQVGMGF